MKDEKLTAWNLSDEFLLESAEKRFQNGDYIGALTVLNKRAGLYAPSADASALYADVYEEMELYPLAADAWFRFLDTCNEADFSEGYEGLGIAFMNMGNDMQSAYYYQRAFFSEGDETSEEIDLSLFETPAEPPRLRLVHTQGEPDPETLREGLSLLKQGELAAAREKLGEVAEDSSDYPSAAGLAAMCTLMLGEEERAERECEELLRAHPDNVQALTTYCAVLGARGNKEAAKRVASVLSQIETDAVDDLYRIATALCETGLDEAAYDTLSRLTDKLPYDENVLYFLAVSAYRTGRVDKAISALERMTTVYPRKAVAGYYLERLRKLLDGEEKEFPMTYYYRVPEDEYRTIADFLLAASRADERETRRLSQLSELNEFFRIAFDEMEGRDEKLQTLAAKVAVKTRSDDFLREALLDYQGNEMVKLSILHGLVMRNEEDSFGTVFLNLYKEFFTHRIDIGKKKSAEFLRAFADVYSKYALFGEENENKLCAAAEDVYHSLEEGEAWEYMDERAALAAAIYREARMKGAERSIEEIAKLFDANRIVTQEILDYMI